MQQLLNLIEFTISISTKLQRTRSAREVQMLLKEEFMRSGYVMVVFGLSDDGSKIVVREVDAKFEKLRSIPGMRLEGLEFGAEHVKDYMALIMSGETVQFSFRNAAELVLPPRLSRAVCSEVVEGMGLEIGTISPIRVRGKVIGIFYMATPRLSEFLTIPIKSLTEHISNALERIELESDRTNAEDALRLKNILLTTQQETSLDGVLIVDENARIINCNQKFVEMWQIPPKLIASGSDEVILKSVLGKIADPQSFVKKVNHLYEHRQEHSRDEIVFKDGRIVDRYSAPMFGQGRYYGRIWYFRDITEMKRYEESLKERDIRLKKFGTQVPGMLYQYVMRPDGTSFLPFTTDGIKAIFGCSPDDVKDNIKPILDVVFPEDQQRFMASIEDSAKRMTPWQCEYRVKVHRKPVRWMWGHSVPERMPDGSIIWHGFNTDITERKKAEDALRESEVRFRTAFDKAATGMVIVSLDGTFLKANAAFCRMLGYSKGEMVGKRVVDVTHPDDIARSLRILKRQGMPNARAQTFEKRYLKKNGETVWGYSISNTVKGNGGRAIYLLAQIADITDRKKLEEENRRHSEHLEALVEERTEKLKDIERLAAIGETTTWVGHDLRNPLQSIVNTVYLMRDTINRCTHLRDKEFMLGSLERLERNVRYMDGIVSNLNEYARPTPPKRSPVRMPSLISEALDRTTIPQEISVRKDLAPVTTEVDRAMILRALVNVLTNAVQAMPDGGVLSVSCAPYAGGAKIEVEDTGHGIDPADMDKLFKLFFTKKPKGMGMGLPVTKKFVEMHGGTLDIRSELGKGTKVTIWLPMKERQKTEAS